MKDTVFRFQTRQGLLLGFLFSGRATGNLIFTYLSEKRINPNNFQMDTEGIYPLSLGKNVIEFLPIMLCFYSIVGFIAISLSFKVEAQINQSKKKLNYLTVIIKEMTINLYIYF